MDSSGAGLLLILLLMAVVAMGWFKVRVHALEGENLYLKIQTGSPQAGMVSLDERFVQSYRFPPGMLERALKRCPERTNPAHLEQGLRQYLVAAGSALGYGTTAAMPSRVVDEAWHEFMLYTRAYAAFCGEAFGTFLHHEPEVAMTEEARAGNQSYGLLNTWWSACQQESLDPAQTQHAPLLFRIDAESGVSGAHRYTGLCDPRVDRADDSACLAVVGTVCVAHGLGSWRAPDGSGWVGNASGMGGAGGGCGGGCGGGGGGCGGGS